MSTSHLHARNMIGMPTALFASAAFNLTPMPTHVAGVEKAHARLFKRLEGTAAAAAPGVFTGYMAEALGVPRGRDGKMFSYLRLLRGWFFDSNQLEGAIMKGWAESRFGLAPLYHGESIADDAGARRAWRAWHQAPRLAGVDLEGLFTQLDLLYEYAQWWLARFGPRPRYFTLYRGANRVSPEHRVREERERDLWVVRNNNLVSYSLDRERADEFGDAVLKVEAPFEKILCFPELLSGCLPHYEREYILIGGDYLTEILPG
ncbi:MAG: NAD(+)--dinitrogen-reductase ADP-D-ribosyltransferase [Nitrospirae bacterium]|nr:NAD(+)--dinitrogen-reductase ADP-D-ribosyltransferase [Nitrospirota bacterium]